MSLYCRSVFILHHEAIVIEVNTALGQNIIWVRQNRVEIRIGLCPSSRRGFRSRLGGLTSACRQQTYE